VTAGITGSLFGTSSFAISSVSSSYPITVTGSTLRSVSPAAGGVGGGNTDSIFFGYNAGVGASSISNSNFLGADAGYLATDAYYSNFIGNNAGNQAASASYSNFLGYQAGYSASYANNSNFFGADAGLSASLASNSNFLGTSAGQEAINSINSNFLGENAGYQAADANNSNFLGYQAGYLAIEANNSNFIGQDAGIDAAYANNSNFFGNSAGYLAASASYSTLIGYRAGYNNAGLGIGPNNIIIGTNITLENERVNSINLGGLIFGTGSYSSSIGNPFSGSANGRIGINQPLPTFNLDVSGSGRYTDGLIITGSLIAPNITGSLQGTASWALNAITASYVELAQTASSINFNIFQITTGSITASVNTTPNSLFLIQSGSTIYHQIESNSNTSVYSNLYIIKNYTTNQPVLTVSQSIIQFATQSLSPSGVAPNGGFWFTSTDLYIGLE
jgi:hypothetical protein